MKREIPRFLAFSSIIKHRFYCVAFSSNQIRNLQSSSVSEIPSEWLIWWSGYFVPRKGKPDLCRKATDAFQEPSEAIETHSGRRRPGPLYTLTRICSCEYMKRMESVFEVIAESNRRAILSLLGWSQQSVGEIEHHLRMPQPTVSKHLRVLREAGFVESTVDAQRRLYRLKPEPLQEVDAWLAPFRRFWSAHVDALERHLDRMDQSTPRKRKASGRRSGPNRERGKGETK